jgi:hypothetical protein
LCVNAINTLGTSVLLLNFLAHENTFQSKKSPEGTWQKFVLVQHPGRFQKSDSDPVKNGPDPLM